MVMTIEPIARCIRQLQAERTYDAVLYMTPDGERFEQKTANRLSLFENLIILCGHYKGVDERVREQFITREISIGDYVLSGGELAACVVCVPIRASREAITSTSSVPLPKCAFRACRSTTSW